VRPDSIQTVCLLHFAPQLADLLARQAAEATSHRQEAQAAATQIQRAEKTVEQHQVSCCAAA